MSCLDATEVNVTVQTDLQCPNDLRPGPQLDRTEIMVLVDGEYRVVGSKDGCTNGRVGNIVFVPGKHNEVRLRVRGTIHNRPRVLDADRILRFLPHQSLKLTVDLSTACLDIDCPMGQTCVAVGTRGICREPPDNLPPDGGSDDGGVPEDADTLDAIPITDSTIDLGVGEGGLDASLCPRPLGSAFDLHWGFNEGQGSMTTQDDSKTYLVSLDAGAVLQNPMGVCGSGLLYTSMSAFNLQSTNWTPSPSLSIAFSFSHGVGTAGLILSRNRMQAGGWEFKVSVNTLAFVLYTGATGMALTSTVLPNKQYAVLGQFQQGTMTLYIDKIQVGSMSVGLNLQKYMTDILVGPAGATPKIAIDELYLGP